MTLHEEQQKVQKAMNAAFSGLKEDPWLVRRVLANEKGEGPVKKKISVGVLLIAALMMLTAAAFAATNWSGITEFLGKIVGCWAVNEEAIATPVMQSSTSEWLKVSATEAYWAEDGLSIVLKVDAADDRHIVCYSNEQGLLDDEGEQSGQIEIHGELMPLDQWRGEKELIVTSYPPLGEGWTWYKRTDEGLFVIVTSVNPDAEALKRGAELQLQILSENAQTQETEDSTLVVSLPPMSRQGGRR